MVAKKLNKFPSEVVRELTDEQLLLLMQLIKNDSLEDVGCQDEDFNEWADKAEKGMGWAQTDDRWVEVPMDDDDVEDSDMDAIERAAKIAVRKILEDG